MPTQKIWDIMKKTKLFNIRNIIIAIFTIMILMAGIIIASLLNQDDGGANKNRTNITGLPTSIPNDISAFIKAGLYNAIALNLPEDETPPSSGAIIREGSFQEEYNESTDLHIGDFITDVESVEQSFSIHYEWTDDKNNSYMSGYPVMVTCVEKSERIYNTTTCVDAYHSADPSIDDFADKYLPYFSQTETGIDYNIIKDYSDTEPIIAIVSYTCEGSKDAEAVKKSSEAWLKSTGVTLDSSKIIQKNYCDGMMDNFPALVKRK